MSIDASATALAIRPLAPVLKHSTASTTPMNAAPRMQHRPAGEHARTFGADWHHPAQQHRYRRESGLPMVHAAIVNEDWDTALDLVCADDLGLQWLPPDSHHSAPAWTNGLFSTKEATRQFAIIDMALAKVGATTVRQSIVAYGANLLTLSMLTPCRPDVRGKVLQLAVEHNSPYLHLPDGSGRTPLWVAIDQGDIDAVTVLLDAGTHPLSICPFASEGINGMPLVRAATAGDRTIFALCLEKVLAELGTTPSYTVEHDVLQLQRWTKNRDEADIRWLADRIPRLRNLLFSLPDRSGTSVLHRSVIDGTLASLTQMAASAASPSPGSFCFHPLIGSDARLGPSALPLMTAAFSAEPQAFGTLVTECLALREHLGADKTLQASTMRLVRTAVSAFIHSRSADDLAMLVPPLHARTCLAEFLPAFINKLEDVDLIAYQTLIAALWPALDNEHKLKILERSASGNDGRTEFVAGMPGPAADETTLQRMIEIAARYRNRTAFEFACERSVEIREMLEQLMKHPSLRDLRPWALAERAVAAGSAQWFSRIAQSGITLDVIIFQNSEFCLPILSDLDPAGLSARLASLASFCDALQGTLGSDHPYASLASVRIHITGEMIDRATTAAGKQALRNLQRAGSSLQ